MKVDCVRLLSPSSNPLFSLQTFLTGRFPQPTFLEEKFQLLSLNCNEFPHASEYSSKAGEWAASTSQEEQPHHERTRSPWALPPVQAHPNIHVYCSIKTGASKIWCKLASVCEQISMFPHGKFKYILFMHTEVGEEEAQLHSLPCLHEPSSRCYDVVIPFQTLRASPIIGWILAQAKCRWEDCQEATATTLEGRSPM